MSEAQESAPHVDPKVQRDRQLLMDAHAGGTGATLWTYIKLSGPGWLQSAITLGGGTLGTALYLGVVAGYDFLWLQPLMMILGVIMLSAIAYVTLSTGERPFGAINRHINPVLGWGWLIAAMIANLVWAMPQFSLGTAAIQQNLFPGVDYLNDANGKYICAGILFVVGTIIVFFYDTGGVKFFELLLKVMVGLIVISFFGVVVAMSMSGHIDWGAIAAGYIPDFSLLNAPSSSIDEIIRESPQREFWTEKFVATQQNVMIGAAATAVGINMTFLLPYSMLRKGWDKQFRGLASFDLFTGLLIPFMLAASCVVIASAASFHGKYDEQMVAKPAAQLDVKSQYYKNLAARVSAGVGEKTFEAMEPWQRHKEIDALPDVDKQLASMLVQRDAEDLAVSLDRLFSQAESDGDPETAPQSRRSVAQYVFGFGVVGMAISTIIILMLINGFCVAEMFNTQSRIVHLLGCLLPGISGALGFLYLWGDENVRFWLVVPTSRIGMILLPVAYVTFFFMMNSKRLLGIHRPTGFSRMILNLLMLVAIGVATYGCALAIWNTKDKIPGTDIIARWPVLGVVVAFILLAIVVHFMRKPQED